MGTKKVSRKGEMEEKERRGGIVSILSEPRILEFEFVSLSTDSIVIAYLRGACSPGQPYPPTLCDAIRRPTRRHACMHVFSHVSVTRNHPAKVRDVYRR